MKFQLTTAGYEKNITSLLITDEDGDTPLMKITYKDNETAEHEERRFVFFKSAIEAHLCDSHIAERLTFEVLLSNNMLIITGNVAKALYFIKQHHLLSESTCEQMIFTPDEPELAKFLTKNKDFALPPEPESDIEDEVISSGNGLPHVEPIQKRL